MADEDLAPHQELIADDSIEDTKEEQTKSMTLSAVEIERENVKAEMDDFIERFISLYSDLQNIEKMRYYIK